MHGAFAQPEFDFVHKLLFVEGDTTAAAPQRKRRANQQGEAPPRCAFNLIGHLEGFFQRAHHAPQRDFQTGVNHGAAEAFAVFGELHGFQTRANQFDAVAFQHT